MFHHYSVRPFVTLCRRALCGCLLLLLTVPAAMGDTQLPAAAYPQRHGDLTPREQAMAVKARNTSSPTTNRRPGWSTRSTTTLQPPCGTAPPGRTDGRPRARYHRQGTVRSAADQVFATLNTVPLFQNQMPNKAYNTITAQRSIISTSPARSASHPSISAECCCG